MVREPVQNGSRQSLAAEYFGPLLEGQVRRHDHAVAHGRLRVRTLNWTRPSVSCRY